MWLEKTEYHCQRALELDSKLAEAHMSRAYILWSPARNFAHGEAIEEIQHALDLQPNVPHAHNRLGTFCAHVGRLEEALTFYERVRRTSPQNRSSHGNVQAYVWGGAFEAANRETELWLKESPGHIYPVYFCPLPALLSGDLKTAATLVEDAMRLLQTNCWLLRCKECCAPSAGKTNWLWSPCGELAVRLAPLAIRTTPFIKLRVSMRSLATRRIVSNGWNAP
jgi:tetratricopeptide (TPR) repeat protein